jgi:hypothetical protein
MNFIAGEGNRTPPLPQIESGDNRSETWPNRAYWIQHFQAGKHMTTRRDVIKGLGSLVAATSVTSASSANAQVCSTAPLTNTSTAVRMPLEEFVKVPRLVNQLRKGIKAMKERKPSDPRSWFYQAAIHGVWLPEDTDPSKDTTYYDAALKKDPDLAKVDRKFWNQCPHFGQNSANFLPWHRAYTYYFELILRDHIGDPDFALPYWNCEPKTNRQFPKEFGIEHLDGNKDNSADDNINPLFHTDRDVYFTSYEHWASNNFPLLELSDRAVDISLPMATPVFFGADEKSGLGGATILDDIDEPLPTRGLLESYPHDPIHRAVGGIIGRGRNWMGAMAVPKTAGFDPIFPFHHSNIDRLWAKWSCMPGKSWVAAKEHMPPAYWFSNKPWYFFDVKGNCVNLSRADYFDHRKLGIRFSDEDMSCKPLELPKFPAVIAAAPEHKHHHTMTAPPAIATRNTPIIASSRRNTPVQLDAASINNVQSRLKTMAPLSAGAKRQRLVLRVVEASDSATTVGFDVHLTSKPDGQLTRSSPSFVGSTVLFAHGHEGHAVTSDFEVAGVVGRMSAAEQAALQVVFVPYPLTTLVAPQTPNLNSEPLRIERLEFFAVDG